MLKISSILGPSLTKKICDLRLNLKTDLKEQTVSCTHQSVDRPLGTSHNITIIFKADILNINKESRCLRNW